MMKQSLLRAAPRCVRSLGAVLVAVAVLAAAAGRADARETQLGGVKLGRPAVMVTDLFGDPTRTLAGALPAGGGAGAAGRQGGGMPGMGGGGMPGMGGGMGGGMPGMGGGGMPGMGGGMGGGQAQQAANSPAITWVYERSNLGVTYVFGFNEEGRVILVCVGDDKPYSWTRGGQGPQHRPYSGAKTSKGIGLGDTFKNVILTYGYPESTEILGDEVLLKYFERYGVAFTFRQTWLRVDSITIKSPDE